MKKKSITIIGGGPSALMLAAQLDEHKFDVTIYERNVALGRKFLVAGDGGFNLTHSEAKEQFISRYIPSDFFQKIISQFSNTDLINWLKSIGIETYVGSSKRVFPVKGTKPIDVLNAILNLLEKKNVKIKTNHCWRGWEKEELVFNTKNETVHIKSDIVVFALGGASWKVTGSDGSWVSFFSEKGIDTVPFQASNCAFGLKWNIDFLKYAEGKQLKNIALQCGDAYKKGELVITAFGLEGGAIYALSGSIRKQLNDFGEAKLLLDLKPQLTVDDIKGKFKLRGNRSIKKLLQDNLNLDDVQVELLKSLLTKEQFTNLEILAQYIKQLPLKITAAAPIDEAISTVGGIALAEIDANFQLKKRPDHYVIGEMLDWDAPTGGYLLQACFSMGYYLAKELNTKVKAL
jgi:uncharacterized flavoprotein (TIGR03862 family)